MLAKIPVRFPFVVLDAFVIMPDHVHGIIIFDKPKEKRPSLNYQNSFGPQRENLAAIIRGFKSGVSALAKQSGLEFNWQSRFHDRVVRNDVELERFSGTSPIIQHIGSTSSS